MGNRAPVLWSLEEPSIAAEKGRLLAAQAIAHNPEQRKRVEDVYGLDACKRRYPEAYSPAPFFRSILDRLKFVRT